MARHGTGCPAHRALRFSRTWQVVALVLIALCVLPGCAHDARSPATLDQATNDSEVSVKLHASAGAHNGEVCVQISALMTAPRRGGSIVRGCSAVTLPAPPIGGYEAHVLHQARRAYLWGLTGPGVVGVALEGASSRAPTAFLAAGRPNSGCCGVFLLLVPADYVREDANLVAYDQADNEVGRQSIEIRGLNARQGS